MSGFQKHDRDFSSYDHMSTDDLREILRADFELPDGEESDMEKILYIMEVIAQRRKGHPTGRYANEEEAWASFVENYCPEPEREVLRGSKAAEKPRRGKRFLMRAASVAAAIALVLTIGSVTASAFNFNFWAWLAGWTREVFGVQDPKHTYLDDSLNFPEQLTELRDAMEKYGFPDRLLPTWLPDGSELTEWRCDVASGYVHLHGRFKNDQNEFILLDYYMHLDNKTEFIVQKDGDEPEDYIFEDVTHHIMANYETYYATWSVDNVVCGIFGFTSRDELIRMINSIYREYYGG